MSQAKPLNDREKETIRALCGKKGYKAIAREIGRAPSTVLAFFHKEGLRSGLTGRFQKGAAAWNKGKSWEEQGRSPEACARSLATCFGKGNRPWNEKPVGSERLSGGYVLVKAAEGRKTKGGHTMNYRMKARVDWEKANGPLPEGTRLLRLDGDPSNGDPANLLPVESADVAVANRSRMLGDSPEGNRLAIDVARIKRAKAGITREGKGDKGK